MNASDYFKKLEGNPEYLEAERKHKLILDIADEVLRLRIERGWSQAELAERSGTKQANISRLENGMLNPSVNFLEKIAKALGADVSIGFVQAHTRSVIEVNADSETQETCLAIDWLQSGNTYNSFKITSGNFSS